MLTTDQAVGRHPGAKRSCLELMSITGDVAFLPVARPIVTGSDQYEAFVQPIDLRRGTPLGA